MDTKRPVVLFVSNGDKHCGVYQFGKNIASALSESRAFGFEYLEVFGPDDLRRRLARGPAPSAIIYNHHPATMRWLTVVETAKIDVPQAGIIHDVTQAIADVSTVSLFDFHIAPDPTLLLRNPRVFKTGRLLQPCGELEPAPTVPTIGSFGFATPGKNFDEIIRRVEREFDTAKIRINVPFAHFGDRQGERARELARNLHLLVRKPGIDLEVSHDFLDDEELRRFLEGNSLNVFLYADAKNRGISSVLDHALGVKRPLALSSSSLFRHVLRLVPSVNADTHSLREIIDAGSGPLEPLRKEWTKENLVWDYERIAQAMIQTHEREFSGRKRSSTLRIAKGGTVQFAQRVASFIEHRVGSKVNLPLPRKLTFLGQKVRRVALRRLGYFGTDATGAGDWVPSSTAENVPFDRTPLSPYVPASDGSPPLNRALDDDARDFYAPAIAYLAKAAEEIFARKIARANVQQAFVLDTVVRLSPEPAKAKLLSVGSYEDTASIALIRSGYDVEDVDPLLNYDLGTFLTKPTTKVETYDVVFSTSVIEHVFDDDQFVRDIASLLKPGGHAVLTCDFRDDYKPGDAKPSADQRLYTRKDLEERLLSSMPGFELVGEPRWHLSKPDFEYAGTIYSFATFVAKKLR